MHGIRCLTFPTLIGEVSRSLSFCVSRATDSMYITQGGAPALERLWSPNAVMLYLIFRYFNPSIERNFDTEYGIKTASENSSKWGTSWSLTSNGEVRSFSTFDHKSDWPISVEGWKVDHFLRSCIHTKKYLRDFPLVRWSFDLLRIRDTFGPLILWKSRDSISAVTPHWFFGLWNRIKWHKLVKIESRDCQDMREPAVQALTIGLTRLIVSAETAPRFVLGI